MNVACFFVVFCLRASFRGRTNCIYAFAMGAHHRLGPAENFNVDVVLSKMMMTFKQSRPALLAVEQNHL